MNCKQIQNLLYYYIYNELNPLLQEYISMHLEECEQCSKFYDDLFLEVRENKNFETISAYIDHELSDKENIQVKKNIISNAKFREEFEKLFKVNNLLKSFFAKQEYNQKEDFSKKIFRELDLTEEVYGKSVYPKVAGIFIVIFMGLFLATLAIIGI